MKRKERVEKLRCLITCMKCEVSGKECDNNCPTQYDAGNMGEIIENLEEIAKALEQEPCEDAVSRQALYEWLDGWKEKNKYYHPHTKNEIIPICEVIDIIQNLPPVSPKTRQRLCRTCIYGDKTEYDKPCIIYSDSCQLYKAKILDKIRAEIKEWYWQADKQALAKDSCVVDAMVDLFIRTIDKYKAESEDKE